jgi:hypothetical protein
MSEGSLNRYKKIFALGHSANAQIVSAIPDHFIRTCLPLQLDWLVKGAVIHAPKGSLFNGMFSYFTDKIWWSLSAVSMSLFAVS